MGQGISHFWGQLQDAHRYWRKYRLQAANRTGINLNRVERSILDHLYTEEAEKLGLSTSRIGPVLAIQGKEGRFFHTMGVWTDFDTMPLGEICGDKVLTRGILSREGLDLPEGKVFCSAAWSRAWEYVKSLECPVVVKPARGTSSGRGVTVRIQDRRAVRRAFSIAALYCPDILIERFVTGENYRLLVYKGKTISAILRDLPSVVGDGVHAVRALIDMENAKRVRSSQWKPGDPILMPLPVGKRTVRTLELQSLSMKSVPAAGTIVRTFPLCNYAFGATYREVLSIAHPTILDAAERASRVMDLTLSGVDIIAPDITRPEHVINEVNTTPGLETHYSVRNVEERRDPIRLIFEDYFGLHGQ